jgi:hypothetical protein
MRTVITTLAAMTFLAAALPAGGHGPTHASTDPYKAVRAHVPRKAEALVRGDLRELEEIWAQNDVALYEDDIVRNGWREVANHTLRRKLDARPLIALRVSDVKTHINRRTAWSTFKVELTEETGGKQRRASGVGTAIVEMRGGDWKLFHWHVSTVEGDRSELGVGQRVSTEISKDGKTALDVKFSVAKKVTK